MKKFLVSISLLIISISLMGQITNGLVAWYPFNGNAKDASGNNINGYVQGANLTWDRFGIANSAYFFDGVNDFIDLGDNLDNTFSGNNKKFSISLWFYIGDTNMPLRVASNNIKQLLAKSGTTTCNEEQREFTVWVGNGSFKFALHNSLSLTDYWNVVANYPIVTHVWYHAVVNYNGTINTSGMDRIEIYLNDKKRSLSYSKLGGTLSYIRDGSAHIGVGNNLNSYGQSCSPNKFNGKIDDIRIYNRVLNSLEVDTLYNLKPLNIKESKNIEIPAIYIENSNALVTFTYPNFREFILLDISGKVLQHYPSENSTYYNFDISNLQKGMYLLLIQSNESNKIVKFIK